MSRGLNHNEDFPWWLVALGATGVALAYVILTDPLYAQIFRTITKGLQETAFVTCVGFLLASTLGLIIALMALSNSQVLRQIARFYVELIRGLPILVLLFYITFVAAPAFVTLVNMMTTPIREMGLIGELQIRDVSLEWRAIIALTIGYSAFLSEIFRAGIISVDVGQSEAAKSLGLNRWLRFRLVIFPQGIKTILPPLGNDFIAMVKDSSLVSVLGVADMTQIGKVYASGSFRFFETYSIIAYLYLAITISLSLALRRLERYLRQNES